MRRIDFGAVVERCEPRCDLQALAQAVKCVEVALELGDLGLPAEDVSNHDPIRPVTTGDR